MSKVLVTTSGRLPVQRRGFPFAPSGGLLNASTWSGIAMDRSIALLGGYSKSYAQIYRSQPWVYAAVRKRQNAIGMLPLKLYRMVGQDASEREVVRGSDSDAGGKLAQLLNRPNPSWTRTPTEFKRAWSQQLDLYGNFLAVKMSPSTPSDARPLGLPGELWPVPWHRVSVVEGERTPVAFYVVNTDAGDRFPFRPEEVIHDTFAAPDGPVGVSPLEPLRRTLAIEDAASRETLASFANAGRPSGAFVTEGRGLSPDQAQEIRKQLMEEHGGVDNAFKIAVLGGGLKWTPLSFNHQEQELIPSRKLTREEVAAVYGIDPTQLGILDRATFSNVTEAHRSFYMDCILPVTTQIEETLEAQLIAPEPEWSGLDLEFDMHEVLKADISATAEAYTKLARVGFSPNYFLHLENQPPIDTPWANTGYIARELMPLDGDLQQEFTDNRTILGDAVKAIVAETLESRSEPPPPPPPPERSVSVVLPESISVPTPQVHIDQAGLIASMREMAKRQERLQKAIESQGERTAEAIAEALRPKVRRVVRDENSNIISIVEEAS